MTRNPSLFRLAGVACALLILASGCHCPAPWCGPAQGHHHHHHHMQLAGWDGMCFGYHPTCWRPWPAECPPCPSPFALPPIGEDIGKPVPHDLPGVPLEAVPLPETAPGLPALPEAMPPAEGPAESPAEPAALEVPSGQISARRHWSEPSTAASSQQPALLEVR